MGGKGKGTNGKQNDLQKIEGAIDGTQHPTSGNGAKGKGKAPAKGTGKGPSPPAKPEGISIGGEDVTELNNSPSETLAASERFGKGKAVPPKGKGKDPPPK